MYRRAMAAACLTALVATGPASAADGAPTNDLDLIRAYFTERDQGWLNSAATIRTSALNVSRDAQRQNDSIRRIAGELTAEGNLIATHVETEVKHLGSVTCPAGAGYRVEVSTKVKWDTADIDYSEWIDDFGVCVEKAEILSVALIPLPTGDGDGHDDPTPAELGILPASTERKPYREVPMPPEVVARNNAASPIAKEYKFNRDAAAAYAVKWATKYNPKFPDAGNNCANFASQSAYAGGWPLRDGVGSDGWDKWHYDVYGPQGPSHTWSISDKLYTFAGHKTNRAWPLGKGTLQNDFNSVWNLKLGDLIMSDWDPNGTADGKIDHTMVVSQIVQDTGWREPAISQHTPFRRNVPISAMLKLAANQGRKVVHLYPLSVADKFKE